MAVIRSWECPNCRRLNARAMHPLICGGCGDPRPFERVSIGYGKIESAALDLAVGVDDDTPITREWVMFCDRVDNGGARCNVHVHFAAGSAPSAIGRVLLARGWRVRGEAIICGACEAMN